VKVGFESSNIFAFSKPGNFERFLK